MLPACCSHRQALLLGRRVRRAVAALSLVRREPRSRGVARAPRCASSAARPAGPAFSLNGNAATAPFRIDAGEVAGMQRELGLGKKELLQSLLDPGSRLARPPVSGFHVAAVGVTPAGDVYLGVNLEFKSMPLNSSVHAEQFLIANLRHHSETVLSGVALNAGPCGHCRQFFAELDCADDITFWFGPPDDAHSLDGLLPNRFGPKSLLSNPMPPLLLQPQRLSLELVPAASDAVAARSHEPLFQRAAQLALEQARESYAPYSGRPAGVALVCGGRVYGGAYLECAAYNPSLPALQSALVHAVMDSVSVDEVSGIEEVVVVERPGPAVQHTPYVRFQMSGIAPQAAVTCLHADWGC